MSASILIVDDDPTFNAVLTRALQRRGYDARGVLDADTRLVLTNAVYLKAAWAEAFREVPDFEFHADGKSAAKVIGLTRTHAFGHAKIPGGSGPCAGMPRPLAKIEMNSSWSIAIATAWRSLACVSASPPTTGSSRLKPM